MKLKLKLVATSGIVRKGEPVKEMSVSIPQPGRAWGSDVPKILI